MGFEPGEEQKELSTIIEWYVNSPNIVGYWAEESSKLGGSSEQVPESRLQCLADVGGRAIEVHGNPLQA